MAPVYSVFVHQPRPVNEPFFGVSPYLSRACPGRLAPPLGQRGLERSIRRVMNPYGTGDLYEAALLPSYRCLRRRRPREDNQAVAVSQDDQAYKILLDVRDFPENCLSVRAVGDTELVVEGKIQTREESAPSGACKTFKNTTRDFQQRFVFPGIQVDGIVSCVSSDGVLTIVAPKKAPRGETTKPTDQQQVGEADSKKVPNPFVTIPVERQSNAEASTNVDSNKCLGQSSDANQTSQDQDQNAQAREAENRSDRSEKSGDSSSEPAAASAFEQESSLHNEEDCMNDLVPILPKGLFFHDDFFEDSRPQYEDAVNKVMNLVNKDLKVPDPIDWYKILRTDNEQEDTRAGAVTESDDSYKVVLDVRDFDQKSLSVRAVGASELLVEGNVDKKDGDVFVCRSFMKHFALPGPVGVDTITSALSTDGILTIMAPKKKPVEGADSFVAPSSTAGNLDSRAPSRASSEATNSASTTLNIEDEARPASSQPTNDCPRPPTTAADATSTSAGQENARSKQETETGEDEQDAPKFLLIGFAKDLSDHNLKENVKQRKNAGKAQNQKEEERDNDPTNAGRPCRIFRRGPFYQDSFFENARLNYQLAVERMLDRWADAPSVLVMDQDPQRLRNFDRFHNALSNYGCLLGQEHFDDLTCYKTLRHRSPKEESQAFTVRELEHEFKIVLDVHGFSAEDLSIRATSHNELVVEGNVDHTGPTGAVSCHEFSKHFFLPKPVKMNEVTAALSEDDVLSISVPKHSALRIML